MQRTFLVLAASLMLFSATGLRAQDAQVETYGGGPVGVETLAAALAEARDAIEDVIEPYLMQQGFVMRTPRGRVAATKAYERLGKKPPSAPPSSGSLFGEK